MTSAEHMALWATFNALLRSRGEEKLDDVAAQVWCRYYDSELEIERAFRRTQEQGRVWE